jgi:alpha-N-arabinofuranosidase
VSPDNKNNWLCALSEAAFMTGLERNADVVYMASYAPLFAHAEKWQWTPDLIWFDNLNSYGTPSYYVQKLFSTNRGTDILSIENKSELYASAVLDKKTKEVIVKIVNASDKLQSPQLLINGTRLNSKADVIVLKGVPDDVNAFGNPEKIVPVKNSLDIKGKSIKVEVAPYSLTVIKIKTR